MLKTVFVTCSECIGHAGTSSDALNGLARTERGAAAVALTRRRLQLFASFHSTRARTHQYKQATDRLARSQHNTCHARSDQTLRNAHQIRRYSPHNCSLISVRTLFLRSLMSVSSSSVSGLTQLMYDSQFRVEKLFMSQHFPQINFNFLLLWVMQYSSFCSYFKQ